MIRTHPHPHVDLPISIEIYQQLLGAAIQSKTDTEAWEIGAMAIREWMARQCPDMLPMNPARGYQWKHLFLPTGTLLRTVFNGKNHHAFIDGDALLDDGKASSPSRFVNGVGGVRRNAWKLVWILLPGTPTWKRAAEFRVKRRRNKSFKRRSGT